MKLIRKVEILPIVGAALLVTLGLMGMFAGLLALMALVVLLPAAIVWFVWTMLAPVYLADYVSAAFLNPPFLHVWGALIALSLVVNVFTRTVSLQAKS
jgi:hypothetical protein